MAIQVNCLFLWPHIPCTDRPCQPSKQPRAVSSSSTSRWLKLSSSTRLTITHIHTHVRTLNQCLNLFLILRWLIGNAEQRVPTVQLVCLITSLYLFKTGPYCGVTHKWGHHLNLRITRWLAEISYLVKNTIFWFIYLSVSTHAVIDQFFGPYSTVRPAKFERFLPRASD